MNRQQEEQALMTREQRYRARKHDRMFISRKMVTSPAFRALKTPASYIVLFAFLDKCQWKNLQIRPGCRDKSWVHVNNGDLTLSYNEARENLGLSDGKFIRAIEDLIHTGFIDINKTGCGVHREVTTYWLSSRWQQFGTSEFEKAERVKRKQAIGFKKGNQFGRRCKSRRARQGVEYTYSAVTGNG